MFNLIGAVLVTAFVLGLVVRRASFKNGEALFREAPKTLHWIIVFFLIFTTLQGGLGLFNNFAPIFIGNLMISWVTLWVHEAGHVYFNWGWLFLACLGGTLNELFFPILPGIYCWVKGYRYFCSLFIFWLGHNLFGISKYIADARARVMPLLSEGDGIHDWEYVLNYLGIIKHDVIIGNVVWSLAWPILLLAIFMYILTVLRESNAP